MGRTPKRKGPPNLTQSFTPALLRLGLLIMTPYQILEVQGDLSLPVQGPGEKQGLIETATNQAEGMEGNGNHKIEKEPLALFLEKTVHFVGHPVKGNLAPLIFKTMDDGTERRRPLEDGSGPLKERPIAHTTTADMNRDLLMGIGVAADRTDRSTQGSEPLEARGAKGSFLLPWKDRLARNTGLRKEEREDLF